MSNVIRITSVLRRMERLAPITYRTLSNMRKGRPLKQRKLEKVVAGLGLDGELVPKLMRLDGSEQLKTLIFEALKEGL